MATKVAMQFHKNFIYIIRTLSLICLWNISFLAERVHVSEILRHFSHLNPTQSRLVYDPTGTILAILYSEVHHMLPAKYQPNMPGGSGEEVIWMVFNIYGHRGQLEFYQLEFYQLETKQLNVWGTKAELRARVGRPQTSWSPLVIFIVAVPRRLFRFGSLVILDVARCYLWLFTLYINIKIGKNSC